MHFKKLIMVVVGIIEVEIKRIVEGEIRVVDKNVKGSVRLKL